MKYPVPGQAYTREEMEAFQRNGPPMMVLGRDNPSYPGASPSFASQDNKFYFTENLEILHGSIKPGEQHAVWKSAPPSMAPPEDSNPCWHGSQPEYFEDSHEYQKIIRKVLVHFEKKPQHLDPMKHFEAIFYPMQRAHERIFRDPEQIALLKKHCFAWATREMLKHGEGGANLQTAQNIIVLGLSLHFICHDLSGSDQDYEKATAKLVYNIRKMAPSKRSTVRLLNKYNGCQCFANFKFMSKALIKVRYCDGCRDPKEDCKACARCKMVYYCSTNCQRAHWRSGHKQECGQFKKKPF